MSMSQDIPNIPKLEPVANPLNLLPVSLKEAALDSPSFRAACIHFGDQIEGVERWLDNYVKAASRLANEVTSIESLVNTYISCAVPHPSISEAALDQDYTALVLRRYNDGAKEFWASTIRWMKKVESTVAEPIKSFTNNDLSQLKAIKKQLEATQKNFDHAVNRYASQAKTKETSSLREEAFQLHEARRAYLKASMDYCVAAPQIRTALDKLLVKIFSDRWRDMKASRDALGTSLAKWNQDVDRVRGWSREMETYEKIFAKELHLARRQIEDAAELKAKPSRELDSYTASTVPYISNSGPLSSPKKIDTDKDQKQGWLFLKTLTGKPTRTVWVRRWFYVKDGVFGSLQQSAKFSAVNESEKIGVLLCGVRPALQEERRFCFEVKTKSSTMMLQAETQADLMEWITGFEVVKRKALEKPEQSGGSGAPFAITPPIAPEFAAVNEKDPSEEPLERIGTMNSEPNSAGPKPSMDIRRTTEDEPDLPRRDTATRLMQKLSKTTSSSTIAQGAGSMGGIASLIAASHSAMPIAPMNAPNLSVNTDIKKTSEAKKIFTGILPVSTLAPSTLANPPVPTNLSKSAIVIGIEQGVAAYGASHIPAALMANTWGTCNSPYINRLEKNAPKLEDPKPILQPISKSNSPIMPPTAHTADNGDLMGLTPIETTNGPLTPDRSHHQRSQSAAPEMTPTSTEIKSEFMNEYPIDYPASLKAQDFQFRTLFPDVKRQDKLVLVFRATWNPSDQQEFPGRVYVTMNDIYFYSNHLGLVLITGVSLDSIAEVTSAPGKDCDFLFIHLKDGVRPEGATRITVKTFLESQKLLQQRMDYLIQNRQSGDPASLQEVIRQMLSFENNEPESPLGESWEDVGNDFPERVVTTRGQDLKTSLHIDGSLDPKRGPKNTTRFRLPAHPVEFIPQGFKIPSVERRYDVTAKSLFHVLAGDKSAVFQILYCQRGANRLIQTPWTQPEDGLNRREIAYQVEEASKSLEVVDYQTIDVINDHLCYVITERKTAWFLPYSNFFTMVVKIVITHVAKSHCKLSIFCRIEWSKNPMFGKALIDHQAFYHLQAYASGLADIIADQASRLGAQGGTSARKAVNIFGGIGLSTEALQLVASDLAPADLKGVKKTRYRSLPRLVFYAMRRITITYFFVVLGGVVQIVKWIAQTFNTHRFLVSALLASAFANFFFSWKESWTWWQDRKARVYMSQLGVKPNTIMGRSIWIKDLNDFTAQIEQQAQNTPSVDGSCGLAFSELLSQIDASSWDAGSTSATDQQMLHRIARNRHQYGEQRNNLMVGLRLVGRLEQEMLRAEWEEWVWREAAQCKKVGTVLKRTPDPSNGTEVLNKWWDGYCQSCMAIVNHTK